MDDKESRDIFDFKFGPTPLQVAAGVYSGFLWGCLNPDAGIRFPEDMDSDFLLEKVKKFNTIIFSF
jgi:homospermidine synthase